MRRFLNYAMAAALLAGHGGNVHANEAIIERMMTEKQSKHHGWSGRRRKLKGYMRDHQARR